MKRWHLFSTPPLFPILLVFLIGALSLASINGQEEKSEAKATAKATAKPKEESVKPGINKGFLNPEINVEEWKGKFEVESREVYYCRKKIVEALKIKPGTAVADIGAGTGLFMEPFAKEVGEKGKVYAVDISLGFVKNLSQRAKKLGLTQVKPLLCREDSVRLEADSVDLAFVCDTYHHFEYPKSTLASIYKALKPGGRLVVVDFERIPGKSRDWILGHVRAGKEVFSSEIKGAKFELVEELKIEGFKENYFLVFRKP